MKKRILAISTPILIIIQVFLIICLITTIKYSSKYLQRVLTHFDSNFNDFNYFPNRLITKSDNPFYYNYSIDNDLYNLPIKFHKNNKDYIETLQQFIEKTNTTSFIIVKNDNIIYEQYANGYSNKSINTSFSMSKSLISLLIGKAIEENYINSVTDPISKYIDEFKFLPIGENTIEDLLLMRSNIDYNENKFLWFGDDSLTYWYDDLRLLALNHTKLRKDSIKEFNYNNYHPLLLGLIIERTTNTSISKYFENTIWKPIGSIYDASWSLDSTTSGFEKMESGFNFIPIDFIKIGSLIINNGFWNNKQIINSDWIIKSTLFNAENNILEYQNTFLENRNINYNYMWYSLPNEANSYDIIAWGKSDQILYISPINQTIILRTGLNDGGIKNWEKILFNICNLE